MHVNLLGPIEAVNDHGAVGLGGAKQRAVLAMLALQTGSTVSADRLIDGLWGDHPPASALKLVQLYISHLRKALGEDEVIATHGRGYELRLARHDVDAGRFERLLAQGASREALRLWRGSPLADVAGEPFAAPEIRRLEELHTAALEVAIDQDLDAGRHREALTEIDGLLAAEPLHERLHARRMLALYRCGRQADALAAYREARRTLIEQIGVEPGPELRRLHEAILRQDPALDPPVDGAGRTPLFGRERELERLRSLWWRVRDGGSATALITGEPGIGKTRLTLALADEVRREGGEVSWGDGEALTPGRPALLVLDDAVMPPDPGHPALVVLTSVEADGIVADERIALGPLTPEYATGLARFDAGDDGPIDRIVSASRGVPGLIRQAARDWARAQAMARVADAAARTSAERIQLQLTEGDLTTRVEELQEIREPASAALAACPYKGLESFGVEDARVFFGRERLVAEMVARLPGAHLLGIVGPSGCGKSSAMRAGLLAAIGAGVLPGSETWARAVIRPGEHPLLPEAPAGPAVLAVDQFEELFTVCHDEHERAAFVEALLDRGRGDTLVIAAVRADFYGACARYPELSRVLGANHVLVGPMQRYELRRAVELPARRAGVPIEPGLVDALVADVEHEPGALPLLSTALFELWDEGLTLDAYERTGGVRGAVARLAETAYARFGDDGRAEARRILLRLAGDGDVRARVPLAELGDAAVLSALARDRLVTVGEGEAEVAHEALLREWPRLRGWLEEDAEGRRVRHRLTQAARDWDGDSSGLYRGARLAAALDWAAAHGDELNPSERSFLDASRVAAERGTRRLRALAATFAVLLIGALAAGVVALNQRGEARSAALAADAQRLGAEAVSEDHLDRAMALARTGVALDDTPVTRGFLLSVLERNPAAVGEIVTGWINFGGAFSPDGRLFALGDERGQVTVYDARTRLPVAPTYSISALIQQLKFSPDGRRLAVSATNEADPSRALVDIIDPLHARRLVRIVLPPSEADPYVTAGVTFLDDGYALLRTTPGGPASVLYRVDARGVVTGQLELGTSASNPVSEARGRVYVTNARANRTWEIDPERLKVVRTFQVGDSDGAISPDGRRYALGGAHGVRLLDTASGAIHRLPTHARITGLIFTPEGLVAQDDYSSGQLVVWRGDVPALLGNHVGDVQAIALSPDGRTLLTTSRSRRAILWDLAGDRLLERSFSAGPEFTPIDDTPRGIAISPDGRTLAVTEPDGSVELIDTTTLRRRAAARALDHKALSVAFSPDGNLLAVTGIGGRVTLWDAHKLAPRGELRGLDADSQALAFSPDGRLLAAAPVSQGGHATPIRVWDVRTRQLTAFRATSFANLITFSPDSRLLAAAATEAGTELFDSATGRLVTRIQGSDYSRSMAFSPDGRLLFIGQHDGRGRLYTTRGWRPVGREFDGHRDRITFASYSADSRTLATSGGEGTVVLWDVATQKPLGSPLALAPGAYASVALSGTHLFAVSTKGPGVRLDISPASWKRHACLAAGHDLSAQDWADALPGRPQRPVCGAIASG